MRLADSLRWICPQRLAGQLMATVLAVLWLSIAGFGVYAVRAQSAVATAALDAQASTLAHNLALAGEAPMVLNDLDAVAQLLRRAADLPPVQAIAIFDAQGQRLSRATRQTDGRAQVTLDRPGRFFDLPKDAAPVTRRDEAIDRVTAWHPLKAGTLLGWVRVDLGTGALTAARQQLRAGAALACLLAGLCATLALRALLARPLRAIEQARDFAHGLQFIEGQQLPAADGPLETRELAASLNQASDNLLQMRQAMDASLERMRRHEATLVDTNEQLRTIFALSPDALVCFDDAGHVSYTNPAFHHMTGLATAKVVGYPAAALDMRLRSLSADASEFPGLDAYFAPAPGAGPAGVEAKPQRLTLLRPQHRVLEVVGALSQAPSVRRLLYLRDITHESEVDRMKSEFLSMAAHELRTPMTSIHACIELLLMRDFAAPRRQQMLGVMQRQSEVLMKVVNELLDLARIESRGGADFRLADHSLQALLRQGVADLVVPDGRAPPQLYALPEEVTVRVDLDKTARVLSNLLSNAYKYSPPGSDVDLWVVLDRAKGRAGFEVRDQGIGMSAEQLARVGERFYRADPSGHVPGTGLGISIVREILALMGGRLELHSTPGEGTRATAWLPLVAAAAPPPDRPEDGVASRSAQTTLATIAAT